MLRIECSVNVLSNISVVQHSSSENTILTFITICVLFNAPHSRTSTQSSFWTFLEYELQEMPAWPQLCSIAQKPMHLVQFTPDRISKLVRYPGTPAPCQELISGHPRGHLNCVVMTCKHCKHVLLPAPGKGFPPYPLIENLSEFGASCRSLIIFLVSLWISLVSMQSN